MRSLLVLLVAFAALVYAAVAVAMPVITPAGVEVPTAMTLPAATYPWVQPVWTSVGTVTLPTVPHRTGVTSTQPPAWIAIT